MANRNQQAATCFTIVKPCAELKLSTHNDMRLRSDIEKGDLETKRKALETVIHLYLSEPSRLGNSMLMTVIRFLLPIPNHKIKRLLLLFWEIVPKLDAEGKLRPEMILVCDSFRREVNFKPSNNAFKDLQHPNEFIRGSTLRLLCKILYPEILETLVPCIFACLEHPHSYVRRNAALCVRAVFRKHPTLMPDAPRIIGNLLETEHDATTKTHAFIALSEVDQAKALSFVESSGKGLLKYCPQMQLRIVEIIYHACINNPEERWRFLPPIFYLTISKSAAVRLEAAWTFTILSTSQEASKTAAKVYIDLVVSEADNNVKLVVLSKLKDLCDERPQDLTNMVLDLLKVLSNANDFEVQKQTLELSLQLVSSRTVKDYVATLKQQLRSPHTTVAYREVLVETLHQCVTNFPQTASSIVCCLVELVCSDTPSLALTVLRFLRETFSRYPVTCKKALSEVLQSFRLIDNDEVLRQTCWLLGEFCDDADQIEQFLEAIKTNIGELPLTDSELGARRDELNRGNVGNGHYDDAFKINHSNPKTKVTADGTYATQSAFSLRDSSVRRAEFPLREHLIRGKFFLATAVCGALAKVSLKMPKDSRGHRVFAESLLIVTSFLRLAESPLVKAEATSDDRRRLHQCLTMLFKNSEIEADVSRNALNQMLKTDRANCKRLITVRGPEKKVHKEEQVDEPIRFSMLTPRERNASSKNVLIESLQVAVNGNTAPTKGVFENTLLSKVQQLTGRSDPVYSEAYIMVTSYSLEMDVLVVNQTDDTLQNCTLDLNVWGRKNEKVFEKPPPVILAARDFTTLRVSIEVTGIESGLIFGTIAYDIKGSTADRHMVILNDIHVNIVDFLTPEKCSDAEFRHYWEILEWENTVQVRTPIKDMRVFISHISKSARMALLTDEATFENDCGFVAANFYTRSLFKEEAVANLSLVRSPEGDLEGQIRIRARSQGAALRIGEKLQMIQTLMPRDEKSTR